MKMLKSPGNKSVQLAKVVQQSDDDDILDSENEKSESDSPDEEMGTDSSADDEGTDGDSNEENDEMSENSNVEDEEMDADSNVEETNSENNKANGNPNWADAMLKILRTNKPKHKKTLVLSKAKKLNEVTIKPKEETLPFKLVNEEGEIKEESIKVEQGAEQGEKNVEQKKHRRKDGLGIRVKPTIFEREKEKRLKKIATNGVVQLFNAVKQQQIDIEEKLIQAGPMERKREKALKNIDRRAFLDVLMGGTNKLVPEDNSKDLKNEEESEDETENTNTKKDKKVWDVLRDDFGMGAKLKDWNKEESDEESSAPEEMDSD